MDIYTEVLTTLIPDIKNQRDKYGWSERQTRGYVVSVVTKTYVEKLSWFGRHNLVDFIMKHIYNH